MTKQVEITVSSDGGTVWVNDDRAYCIGRFSKRFGMDVHYDYEAQTALGKQCLACTHEPAGHKEWETFRASMALYYGVDVPENTITFGN